MTANSPFVDNHRHATCIGLNVQEIYYQQRSTENIFLSPSEDLTCKKWKAIVSRILRVMLDPGSFYHVTESHFLPQHSRHDWRLRGDTMACLLEILQDFLIGSFRRAQVLLIYEGRTREQRQIFNLQKLGLYHLKAQDSLGQFDLGLLSSVAFDQERRDNGEESFANSLLDVDVRERIIRRAAFRAGVPVLDNRVYDAMWHATVKLVYQLFAPACAACLDYQFTSLEENSPASVPGSKRLLTGRQTMRDIWPVPSTCRNGNVIVWHHTPVPKQIETTAKHLLPLFWNRIYGDDDWLAEEDSNVKTEVEAAEAEYVFQQDSGKSSDDAFDVKNSTCDWLHEESEDDNLEDYIDEDGDEDEGTLNCHRMENDGILDFHNEETDSTLDFHSVENDSTIGFHSANDSMDEED